MSKIAIFYHVFTLAGNWLNIYNEQMSKLCDSRLLWNADRLHIGINGDSEIRVPAQNINCQITVQYNEDLYGEMDTMSSMHKFCVENPDYKVLFLHCKGVTKSAELQETTTAWRRYLEACNIANWERCVKLLDEYDCVGTQWVQDIVLGGKSFIAPCYGGTFWWANASYISKLDPSILYIDEWGEYSRRFQCEFWIGTGNPKHFNFYTFGKNLYFNKIEPQDYEPYLKEE